jgi:hypothetical protein
MVGDDAATLADDERLFDEAISGAEPEAEPELTSTEAATEPPKGGAEPAPEPPSPGPSQTTEPPPAAQEPVLRHVPLGHLLDEREKRQAAERRAQETERVLREMQARQQAEAQPVPEIWDKPGEFVRREIAPEVTRLEQALVQQQQWEQQRSLDSAVQEYGQDIVEKAYAAMAEAVAQKRDPEAIAAHQRIMSNYHPWRGVVDWYKRARVARDPDELLKDPEFIKRAVESYNAQAAANPVTRQPSAAASLPSVSRTGTPAVPEDEADAYDKLSDEEQYDYWARDERGRFKGRS